MVQLSVDSTKPAAWHLEMGRKLATLRDEGIMLVASGNVVHNLRTARWHGENTPYPWATSFNDFVKDNLTGRDPLSNIRWSITLTMKAVRYRTRRRTTSCHCCMCLARGTVKSRCRSVDGIEMGSLSMLSVQVG